MIVYRYIKNTVKRCIKKYDSCFDERDDFIVLCLIVHMKKNELFFFTVKDTTANLTFPFPFLDCFKKKCNPKLFSNIINGFWLNKTRKSS